MSESYDVIVLGGGAMGSAAAYHLSKNGQRVLLLEQFEIDHDRGSSYGDSRIIRYSYDHPTYITLARTVFPMWIALEEESGDQLYLKTGGIDFGRSDSMTLSDTFRTVKAENIQHEVLSASKANERFPAFHFDEDMQVLYQPDTGLLNASQCVRTHIRLAESNGADIRANTPVLKINVHPQDVEVVTEQGMFTAARIIIAAGSWMKELCATVGIHLPLRPWRCQLNYFQPIKPELYAPGVFPAFIAHLHSGYTFAPYGMSSLNNMGVKLGLHGGSDVSHTIGVDYTPDINMSERARTFVKQNMPYADGKLLQSKICLYTMTPDEHFIIDIHPEYPHVVLASPCSGHGFKFSTLIGSILSDLAISGQTSHDISLFKATRFS